MAYARLMDEKFAVLMIFNNDTKSVEVKFDVSMINAIPKNSMMKDELGKMADIKIENGKVKFTMPARTAGIFTVK